MPAGCMKNPSAREDTGGSEGGKLDSILVLSSSLQCTQWVIVIVLVDRYHRVFLRIPREPG